MNAGFVSMEVNYAIDACKRQFEIDHPDKLVKIITESVKYNTLDMDYSNGPGDEVRNVKLYGRADGIVVLKNEQSQEVGIFRVRIKYPGSSVNDEDDKYSDRLQLCMYLHRADTAYTMTFDKNSERIFDSQIVAFDEERFMNIVEDIKNNAMRLEKTRFSVSDYLKQRT